MKQGFTTKETFGNKGIPFKITAVYAMVGIIWIAFSDKLLAVFINDPAKITRLQTYKGWFYVFATALMLQLLIRHSVAAIRKSEAALREIAVGVSAATGVEFFQSLVKHLAGVLHADYVMIGELHSGSKSVNTVAFCAHGEIIENMEYHLKDTPCEDVTMGILCSYKSNITREFPNDKLLAQFRAESYVGTPLLDSAGSTIGLMVVMDTKPLKDTTFAESMLRIFAVRAAAELERKRTEERIKYMAYHDPLTDLPNRTLFYDRLTQALAHANLAGKMLAVVFIDLDQFKNINDTLGHAMGDKLLQCVASRLVNCIQDDITLARMGGDEFTLLLPEIRRLEDAAKIVQTILDAFKLPWLLDGHEFHITASVGIAVCPNDGNDAETMLKNADTAMHRAKELGRNNYRLYTPAMNQKILEKLSLEKSLRHALDNREFVIYYQPRINTGTGLITGMEALLRWQHPSRGLLLPDSFISLAEETGLILPIGEWVLQSVCKQNKTWQALGYPPAQLAVNISPCQFREQNLVTTIERILNATGLQPQWLELEITESVTMHDVDMTIRTLGELRQMGISISIDDFGTGYSSLSYLKQFPINKLKIDRSFVRDINLNEDNAAILTAVIALARSLKLGVIAEGVETREQCAFLKHSECEEMQGFLFGGPVPAEKIEKILKSGNLTKYNGTETS